MPGPTSTIPIRSSAAGTGPTSPPATLARPLRPRVVIGAVVLGCALRAALILIKGGHSYFADTMEYDAAARALLAGHGWDATLPRAPAFPALLAVAYRLAGAGNFAAARWLQLPLCLTAIPLVAWLGARMRAPRAGELAALGVAVAPTLVYTGTMLYPSALYTVLLLAATLLARTLGEGGGVRPAALFGGVLGLLWLTDPIATLPALALAAWAALARGRRLVPVAVAIAVATLIVLPWMARPTGPRGSGFVAKAQYVVWVARHQPAVVGGHRVQDPGDSVFTARPVGAFLAHELELVRRQPGAWAHDWVFEFVHFFAPMPDRIQTANVYTGRAARVIVAMCFLPVLLGALAGAFSRAIPARDRLLLAVLPLATAATYAFFFTQMRYRVPVEPQMLLLASLALLPPRRDPRGG
jgi:hypothetical protein